MTLRGKANARTECFLATRAPAVQGSLPLVWSSLILPLAFAPGDDRDEVGFNPSNANPGPSP